MIVEKRFKIEAVAAKDSNRPKLNYVYLDVEKKTLTAGDGVVLARVPCELDKEDVSTGIPLDVFVSARKGKSKNRESKPIFVDGETAKCFLTGQCVGHEAIWQLCNDKPPDFDAVIPPEIQQEPTIVIDLNYLINVAHAIGGRKLKLHLTAQNAPIGVTTSESDGIGVVMPLHPGGRLTSSYNKQIVLMTENEYEAWQDFKRVETNDE